VKTHQIDFFAASGFSTSVHKAYHGILAIVCQLSSIFCAGWSSPSHTPTRVKGNLLVIQHMPNGSIYRLKSQDVKGLAIRSLANDGDWASFAGKATYLEPGWLEPVGNHRFIVYVEDHGQPDVGNDRFWIQVKDKDGNPVDLSMDFPAKTNSVLLEGGHIIFPHQGN
jgi:hypothetical protein